MWLRPRTELLPVDPRWWEFNDNVKHSITAVGFGLLNLAYVGAALLALVSTALGKPGIGPSESHPGLRYSGLLVGFVLLRSAFLLTLENPEPRYTLECYPVVIVCASADNRSMTGGHTLSILYTFFLVFTEPNVQYLCPTLNEVCHETRVLPTHWAICDYLGCALPDRLGHE